jgi:hypothetical protein
MSKTLAIYPPKPRRQNSIPSTRPCRFGGLSKYINWKPRRNDKYLSGAIFLKVIEISQTKNC